MAMDADKRNVELGQIITYQGYLYGEYPIEGQIISVTVFEKDSKKTIFTGEITPAKKAVEYFENTAWAFTFKVDTLSPEFSAGKTYVVQADYDDKSTKLEFLIKTESEPSCLKFLGEEDILVFTNKENYERGDVIRISGCLSQKAFTKAINVAVYDPQGKTVGTSTITPKSDRTFSDDFVINEKFGLNGTYSVEVDAGGLYSSSKSFVVPEFGAIATLVMLVGVVTAVIMSSKYTKIMPKL